MSTKIVNNRRLYQDKFADIREDQMKAIMRNKVSIPVGILMNPKLLSKFLDNKAVIITVTGRDEIMTLSYNELKEKETEKSRQKRIDNRKNPDNKYKTKFKKSEDFDLFTYLWNPDEKKKIK